MSAPLSPDFLAEAKRWIAFNTVTTRSNGAFAARAAERFRSLGFRVERRAVKERGVSFFNLCARRGPAAGPPLLLNTHSDTVPPGPEGLWTRTGGRPFSLARRGGLLFGLGVADVKLNLLCQWEALRRVGPSAFRRPLVLAATYGEERGMVGARRLVESWRGPKPFLALVGEPSRHRLIYRHRGYLVFRWTLKKGAGFSKTPAREMFFKGKSAHSSTPRLGVNAILLALAAVEKLSRGGRGPDVRSLAGGTAHNQVPAEARLMVADHDGKKAGSSVVPWRILLEGAKSLQKSFGRPYSVNVGRVETGDFVTIIFDCRFPHRKKASVVAGRIRKMLADLCRRRGLPFRLETILNDPPLDAPRRGRGPALLQKALRRARLAPRWEEKLSCTEAGVYDAWGVPAYVWGPGVSTGNVHKPNESISLRDLAKAVDFYEALIRLWCLPT